MAGSTHASGYRGVPALPVASGTTMASRVGDSERHADAPEADCAWHAHNASRLANMVALGEGIVVTETWWTPTTYPTPCCSEAHEFKVRLESSRQWGKWAEAHGPSEESYGLWTVPSADVSVNTHGDFSEGSSVSMYQLMFSDANVVPGVDDGPTRKPPSVTSRGVYVTYGPVGLAPSLAQAGPDQYTPLMDRPHQMLALSMTELLRFGVLELPDQGPTGYSQPIQAPGSVRLQLSSSSKTALNATAMRLAARLAHASALIMDGDGVHTRCTFDRSSSRGTLRPPWVGDSPGASLHARGCFGGHNSTCDLQVAPCPFTASLLRPDVGSARVRNQLMRTVVGSFPVTSNTTLQSAGWQVGFESVVAFHKPSRQR